MSGFSTSYGWLGALLVIPAGVFLVMLRSDRACRRFRSGRASRVLGLSLIGTIIVLFVGSRFLRSACRLQSRPQYGLYITVLAGIVQASWRSDSFKSSGEKVPWEATMPSLVNPVARRRAPRSRNEPIDHHLGCIYIVVSTAPVTRRSVAFHAI